MGEKGFPIQDGPSVPWSLVAPFEDQARKNHGQSLGRLAKRGGLSPCELRAVVECRPWRKDPEALGWLRGWLKEHEGTRAEIERLRAERDALAAVVEEVRTGLVIGEGHVFVAVWEGGAIRECLKIAPTDVLAERDARVWQQACEAMREAIETDPTHARSYGHRHQEIDRAIETTPIPPMPDPMAIGTKR